MLLGSPIIVDEAFRPAIFCWDPNTSTALNPHLFPMVFNTPLTISNFGKTWTLTSTTAMLAEIASIAAGKRCLRWQSQRWLMTNADDRCDEGYGSVAAAVAAGVLSASPVASNTKWYTNDTGGDGKPSGWSNLLFINNQINALNWATALATPIAGAGLDVSHLAMDSELFTDFVNTSTAWRAAYRADSHWPRGVPLSMLDQLDAIVASQTSGAQTAFDDTGNWFLNPVMANAWIGFYQQQQALMQRKLVQGMQTRFPNCTVNDDSFFGRTQQVVTAGGVLMTTLNGRLDATVNSSIVDYTGEEQYGEMNQVEAIKLSGLTYCVLNGSLNPFITVVWENARSMGSVQSGNNEKSWNNYAGAGRTDAQLGGSGVSSASDPCPYWQSILAMTLLMASVPKFVSTGYSPCALLGYYSRSITDMDTSWSNGGVDQANHLFWDNGDRTAAPFRAGFTKQFAVEQSTGNNGTYTINYSNGGIWFDGTNTYFRVNEAIPSPISDGKTLNKSTDGTDALSETIAADLDSHIGNIGQRSVIQRAIYLGTSALVTDTQALANGNFITWSSLRHGSQQTDCVVIGRSSVDKSAWIAQPITGYVNGVSVGVVGSVPANRAYVYLTHGYSPSQIWTYKWSPSTVPNLLVSVDPTDQTKWTWNGASITSVATHPDPINGANTYFFNATQATQPFPVKEGNVYCAAVYAWGGAPVQMQVLKGSDDTVIGTINDQAAASGRWQLYLINFIAPHGETTCKIELNAPPSNVYRAYFARPQVVQGILPGPVA